MMFGPGVTKREQDEARRRAAAGLAAAVRRHLENGTVLAVMRGRQYRPAGAVLAANVRRLSPAVVEADITRRLGAGRSPKRVVAEAAGFTPRQFRKFRRAQARLARTSGGAQ